MEKRLARNLKFLRKCHGYTLIDLAKLIEVSKSALSDYENAKSPPTFEMVYQYSIRFNVDLDAMASELMEKEAYLAGKYQRSLVSPIEMFSLKQKQLLLQQKNEGLEIQINLLRQLLESKESENKTLKLQLALLNQET